MIIKCQGSFWFALRFFFLNEGIAYLVLKIHKNNISQKQKKKIKIIVINK